MPLYFFYTMVQKSQKWPKTQIKGVLLKEALTRDQGKKDVGWYFPKKCDLIDFGLVIKTSRRNDLAGICIDLPFSCIIKFVDQSRSFQFEGTYIDYACLLNHLSQGGSGEADYTKCIVAWHQRDVESAGNTQPWTLGS